MYVHTTCRCGNAAEPQFHDTPGKSGGYRLTHCWVISYLALLPTLRALPAISKLLTAGGGHSAEWDTDQAQWTTVAPPATKTPITG